MEPIAHSATPSASDQNPPPPCISSTTEQIATTNSSSCCSLTISGGATLRTIKLLPQIWVRIPPARFCDI
jgi:hypothetical protein